MHPVTYSVELLEYNYSEERSEFLAWNQLLKIFAGYKRCWSGETYDFLVSKYYDELNVGRLSQASKDEILTYLNRMLESPHESPLEHATVTIHVYNISRACSHQLVRHRMASYSQCSQRYTDTKDLPVVIPTAINMNAEALSTFMEAMVNAENSYAKLRTLGIEKEDARAVLPNATATSLIFSMNFRELKKFFAERCCSKAQEEIRYVANELLRLLKIYYPICENMGAKCIALKKCPESKSCKTPHFLTHNYTK